MKTKIRTPLTLLEACTLMARETVSLLDGTADTLDSASEFRDALAFLNSVQDLGDGGALLAWVESELENARRFTETGQPYQNLVKLDTPFPLPDPAMQIDAVCVLLQATARQPCTLERWEAMRNAVRMLTEMDSLEDMVLTGFEPCGGFLATEGLRSLLEDVQAALQSGQQKQTGMKQT